MMMLAYNIFYAMEWFGNIPKSIIFINRVGAISAIVGVLIKLL